RRTPCRPAGSRCGRGSRLLLVVQEAAVAVALGPLGVLDGDAVLDHLVLGDDRGAAHLALIDRVFVVLHFDVHLSLCPWGCSAPPSGRGRSLGPPTRRNWVSSPGCPLQPPTRRLYSITMMI